MESLPTSPHSPIVAVDDDSDDIDLLRILFRKAGISRPLEIYRHGEELIASLSSLLKKSVQAAVLPSLCFLDVKMPAADGHEVLRWIRKQPELDRMSVVIISQSEHPTDIKQAARDGAQCYLAKYPRPSVLKSVISEAERMSDTRVADEWFGLPENLLLRWGFSSKV